MVEVCKNLAPCPPEVTVVKVSWRCVLALSFGARLFSAVLLYVGNGVRGGPSADLRVS